MPSDSLSSVPNELAQIDARRASARLTQAALCDAAKVALSTYWRIMSGTSEPKLGTVRKLQRALNDLTGAADG